MDVYVAPNQWGMETDGGVKSDHIWQGYEPSCAIHSQYNVLKDYGYTGSVDELIEEATANGWYDPDPETGGTPQNCIGNLLESHGVECDVYVNANRYNLLSELAQGKRVIVSVDADELWDGQQGPLADFIDNITGGGANHALVVSGINTADPENIKVILTDSGTGQAAIEYPIEQFEGAWADGNFTMVVPKNPPPAELNLPAMENFDYDEGHIASIGDVPFDDWSAQHIASGQLPIDEFEKLDVGVDESWVDAVDEYYADSNLSGSNTDVEDVDFLATGWDGEIDTSNSDITDTDDLDDLCEVGDIEIDSDAQMDIVDVNLGTTQL